MARDALTRSTATWKIAADMPLGIVVAHQPGRHEAVANGDDGEARGREIEIAGLLRTLKQRGCGTSSGHGRCSLLRGALFQS
jgi:alkaline phosphatase D